MPPIIRIKKVVSTKFVDEIKSRVRSFQSSRIAARIQVPSDLRWWYWLEFGSATRQEGDAPIKGPGVAYPIVNIPDFKLKSLAWPTAGGGTHFALKVIHPGIRPHPFVRQSIPRIMEQFKQDLRAAFAEGGFRANVIRETLMFETMVYAKALLVENLGGAAPGTREDGNLLGNTAASVFEEEAEIVSANDFAPGNDFDKRRSAGQGKAAQSPSRKVKIPQEKHEHQLHS